MSKQFSSSNSPLSCCNFLICPICSQSLVPSVPSATGNALQCSRNHSFDIAREQYVNLLLKKAPGDTKEMLQARRQFLASGHYAPLSNQINELVARYLSETILPGLPSVSEHTHSNQSCIPILDAGCGEGYYLGQLQRYLSVHLPELSCCYLGIDSSKEAIRMAARHYKDICFIVASIKEPLPIASGTMQVLLNIFAPRNAAEFARVLLVGGLLLVVIPSPNHLQPLRDQLSLLNIEEDKQQHVIQQFHPYFSLRDTLTLDYQLPLDRQAITSLVRMTPNYWHLSSQARQAIEQIEQVQVDISFICLIFTKK